MRKILFLFASLFIALSAEAQKIMEGTAPSLKGETKINLKIDFSETKIENRPIAEWLEYRQAQQPDYNAEDELEKELKPTLKEKIVKAMNKKLDKQGAYVTLNGSANYTLIVYPVSISKKGKNMNTCCILDKKGTVLVKFSVSGSGGTFGSMSNLWGDGYSDSGKSIASFVEKCFK